MDDEEKIELASLRDLVVRVGNDVADVKRDIVATQKSLRQLGRRVEDRFSELERRVQEVGAEVRELREQHESDRLAAKLTELRDQDEG